MALSEFDRELIAATQSGLPLVPRPYEAVGAVLGGQAPFDELTMHDDADTPGRPATVG